MLVEEGGNLLKGEEWGMAVPEPVQIDELPKSVEEFVALCDRVARVPQGGVAMMAVALLVYADDEELGRKCLPVAIDQERLSEGPKGYEGWQLRASDIWLLHTQIKDRAYVLRSYIRGATPENGYRMPDPPYVFEFADSPHSGDPELGMYKVFITSSGASSLRPVTVRRNSEGIWKVCEWSTLVVGVEEPAQGTLDGP
jgi:hypothetical protein